MIKTFLFYVGVILNLIFCSFFSIKVKYLNKKSKIKLRDEYIHKKTTNWAKCVMKLSKANITVNGLENIPKNTTVLFVSNHQSYFDIPLLMSTIDVPKGFIAKKELEKWPLINMWMKYLRCIFMDRDNMRKSAEAIVNGINTLKSGYSMVIFPEGTRSRGLTHNEFKPGSFKLATKSKVPIVPITIDGTCNLLVGKHPRLQKANVIVTIHPLIDVNSLSKENLVTLHKDIENTVFSKLK